MAPASASSLQLLARLLEERQLLDRRTSDTELERDRGLVSPVSPPPRPLGRLAFLWAWWWWAWLSFLGPGPCSALCLMQAEQFLLWASSVA